MNHRIRGSVRPRATARQLAACGLLVAAPLLFGSTPVAAQDLTCKMNFSTKGWSIGYKTAEGKGVVSCSDGSTMKVKVSSKGGGLTVGKSSIDDGHGDFTGVKTINDVLGSYVAGSSSGGAVKSGEAIGMTKGEVQLAITGTGRGWDLGVAFSDFTISPLTK